MPSSHHPIKSAAVTDEQTGRMIISMGYFYNHQAGVPTWLADTWAFSFQTRSWTCINDGTGAECRSCLTAPYCL